MAGTRSRRPIASITERTHADIRMPMSVTHEDIARRAYELFVERGAEHGGDLDDWLRAEQELQTTTGDNDEAA